MNRALWWLVWCDTRSAVRDLRRRALQPVGLFVTVGFVSLIGFFAFLTSGAPSVSQAGVRQFGAPMLVLFMLLGVFSPLGLFFRPAEIDWLFPAPLSRRQLALFNVVIRARTALVSGLVLPLLFSWRGPSPIWTAVGYTLVFLLLQISAQWAAVVRAWLARRLVFGIRLALGLALFLVPLGLAALELRAYSGGIEAFVVDSRVLSAFGTPARPFVSIIAATEPASALGAAVLSLAILAAFVAHIVWLEVPYRELAVAGSERYARRIASMRGDGGSAGLLPATSRLRLPMFPRLGGAGPVCWRQMVELARNPHGVVLVLVVVAVALAGTLGAPLLRAEDGEAFPYGWALVGVFVTAWVPLLMGENIACDFRRDYDRMAVLKSWPVSPIAMATGQIAAAVGFVTAIQLIGIVVIALVSGALPGWLLIALPVLLPAISWIAISIDNLLFLLVPYRNVPEDPGDVGFVGRTFALIGLKLVTVSALVTGALMLGYVTQIMTHSRVVSVSVLLTILAIACVLSTRVVAWAYGRYDVSHSGAA